MYYEKLETNEIIDSNILINLNSKVNDKCWVCQDIFRNLEFWKNEAIIMLKKMEYETFLVGTKLNGLLSENEEVLWELCNTTYSEPLKSELNRELGKLIFNETKKNVDFLNPDILITLDLKNNNIHLTVKSLYIYGLYNKYKRGISQTPWSCKNCNGKGCKICNNCGTMYSESVSELISFFFLKHSNGSYAIFHGAGREDVNAKMLGTGRPFVLEIKNPLTRKLNLIQLESLINSNYENKIGISNLSFCSKSTIKNLKTCNSIKKYRLKIKFNDYISFNSLNNSLLMLNNKIIYQKTPHRVLHRRADKIRERKIYDTKIELFNIEQKNAVITVECDGGLYIMELISGDLERTNPNLSELMKCSSIVEELDVIEIKNIQ